MRAVARTLLGLLVAAGWLMLAVALALWIAEESGFLGRAVRDAAAVRLGALGDDLHLTGVRLRWFDRVLEIDRVELGPAGDMALLTDVRVELGSPAASDLLVRRVAVGGGHVCFSPALANGLQRYSEHVGGGAALRQPAPGPLPTVQVQSLDLQLATRRWGVLPVGRLDLLARSNARDLPELFGRLVPSLTARGAAPGEVFLSGTLDDDGVLALRAHATGLPLGTDNLPPDESLAWLRALSPRGTLELEAQAQVPFDGAPPRGSLRLAVRHGGLDAAGGRARFDALRLDVQAHWTPERLEGWRDPRTWHAVARASGAWNGSDFESTALLGDEAGPGDLLEAWAHCAALPLEHALLVSLDAGPIAERVWDALDPRGAIEAWVGARVPRVRPAGGVLASLDLCALARPAGAAQIAWRGMVRDAAGRFTEGFPLPLERVSGEVAVAAGAARSRPWRVALLDLAGATAATTIRARGVVQAHPRDVPASLPGYGLAEIDLDLDGEHLPVDDRLRAALEGLAGPLPPDDTWRAYQPADGEIGVRLRLYRKPELAWLATDLDLALHGVSLAARDVPVPLPRCEGRVLFRSDGVAQQALGVTLDGALRTAQRARVALRLRSQGSAAAGGPEPELDDVSQLRVEVERFSLTGDDRRILFETFPDVGRAVEEFAPKGFADGTYERVRWRRGGAYEHRAEIAPLAPAQLVPRAFPVIVGDVGGRVLYQEAGGPVEVRIAPLLGTVGDGVRVALSADLPAGAIAVRAAGVDPQSTSVRGALAGLLGDGAGFDSSELALHGRLDLAGEIHLGAERPGSRWRFFVRGSRLALAAGFALDEVRGELRLEDGVLRGEHLDARLAGTAVHLPTMRFGRDGDGWRLDARFDASAVPVDRPHLEGFIDARTLDALLGEFAWQGAFDLNDAALTIRIPAQGLTRLELSGGVVPHGMSIRLGLPLEVERATARIERLVYEGGKVRALVAIDGFAGRLAGRALEDAALLVTYVEPTLSIESIRGRLEGGTIQSLGAGAQRVGTAFSIALADPYPFELALDLRRVQVAGLLRGLFPSGIATRGEMDGELRLAGDLQRLLSIRGSGSMRVRDSRLWSVPVFRALFAQLGLPDTATFDSMSANLRVEDGRVDMQDILLRSPLLLLVGAGALDFDGGMHYDLEVRYELVDRLGPLTQLLYWIQNELLSVSIRGDMMRPVVVLQNPFRRLFAGSEDYRALPLPGYAALPARF